MEKERANNILLRQREKELFESIGEQKRKVAEHFQPEIQQLKLLMSKQSNPELVHSGSHKKLKEIKDHILHLNREKELALD